MKRIFLTLIAPFLLTLSVFSLENRPENEIIYDMARVCEVKNDFYVIFSDRGGEFSSPNAFTEFVKYIEEEGRYEIEIRSSVRKWPSQVFYLLVAHELGHVKFDHDRKRLELLIRRANEKELIEFRKRAEVAADFFAGECLTKMFGCSKLDEHIRTAFYFLYGTVYSSASYKSMDTRIFITMLGAQRICSDPP
jgi:hypothetical protein